MIKRKSAVQNAEKNAVQSAPHARSREAGYSILELLVVLAIIGTLMTLIAPRLIGQVDKSKQVAAKSQAKTLRLALDSFKLDTGRYPSEQEGLSVLSAPPVNDNGNWYGPYLEGNLPLDPWNNAYIYQPPLAQSNGRLSPPVVISYGADAVPGGSGLDADITS